MHYRPEIDGLRALAITPVILFHAGIGWFDGGFIGVDIFFVISGYLITSILLVELQREKLQLVAFWERRARRILPAFFFVAITASVVSATVMLPHELARFGSSLASASVFGVQATPLVGSDTHRSGQPAACNLAESWLVS